VDLTAGATAVLRGAGLTDVRAVGGCTLEQPERFFSYRRDGRTGGTPGSRGCARERAAGEPVVPGPGRRAGPRARRLEQRLTRRLCRRRTGPREVVLVAVTKTRPASDVRLLRDSGWPTWGRTATRRPAPRPPR
jgi:hypothetical protein